MITKILFTIAIIALVVFSTRYLGSSKVPAKRGRNDSRGPMRLAAYAVIGMVIVASALWLILEWRSAHEILPVRVINSATGSVVEYEAYRTDIEARTFRTLDGRRVNLADVERLEVIGQ